METSRNNSYVTKLPSFTFDFLGVGVPFLPHKAYSTSAGSCNAVNDPCGASSINCFVCSPVPGAVKSM